MTDRTTVSTRALIAELARLEDAVRAANPFVAPSDQTAALTPAFLELLSRQLAVIGELRRRRTLWQAALRAA